MSTCISISTTGHGLPPVTRIIVVILTLLVNKDVSQESPLHLPKATVMLPIRTSSAPKTEVFELISFHRHDNHGPFLLGLSCIIANAIGTIEGPLSKLDSLLSLW